MFANLFKRFGCLLGCLALLGPCSASAQEEGVSEREIVIGQSLGLTGPLAELGIDIANGAKAYFDSVNNRGGIHGRKVRLVTLDDAYIPANTARNVQRLLDEERAFALLNIMGTPNSAAILPIIDKRGTVLFSPMTGADVVRSPFRANVFNVRAGYRTEIEKLVQHLSTLGVKSVAVVAQANSFGKEGLSSVETSMASRGMKPIAVVALQTDATDAHAAAQQMAASRPSAIILVTAGRATFEFIKAYNRVARGAQFYTLSVMGAQSNIKALGPDGVGTVVVSVVPFPWSLASPLAKEYRLAMNRNGLTEYSFVSFEGYINARVLGEALQRAGRDLNRAKLIASAEAMSGVNMGEFPVSFSRELRQGSQFVELTLIGANGRFVK